MSDKLKPCPRCGDHINTTIRIITEKNSHFWNQNSDYEVVCKRCHMSSGLAFSKESAIKTWNAFPRHLHWTHKVPTEPGWYFSRANSIVNVVLLGSSPEGLCVLDGEKLCPINGFSHGNRRVEWAGPIIEPIENK